MGERPDEKKPRARWDRLLNAARLLDVGYLSIVEGLTGTPT
jgi:hypothetical protein